MRSYKIVLRINGGQAYATYLVWAENAEKAQDVAQIHLAAATGLDVIR